MMEGSAKHDLSDASTELGIIGTRLTPDAHEAERPLGSLGRRCATRCLARHFLEFLYRSCQEPLSHIEVGVANLYIFVVLGALDKLLRFNDVFHRNLHALRGTNFYIGVRCGGCTLSVSYSHQLGPPPRTTRSDSDRYPTDRLDGDSLQILSHRDRLRCRQGAGRPRREPLPHRARLERGGSQSDHLRITGEVRVVALHARKGTARARQEGRA